MLFKMILQLQLKVDTKRLKNITAELPKTSKKKSKKKLNKETDIYERKQG